MQEIVDRVMLSFSQISTSSEMELRSKVFGYVELLASTGKHDPNELSTLGVEYLRKIVDGPDTRFSGC